MADIKKINVNGTLYDVNLDSTKDVDIKSLKVNDGSIIVGTGDYESMTTASRVTIFDNSIIMQSKTADSSDEIEITVDPGGSYMSVGGISSTEITANTISANDTVQAVRLAAEEYLTVGSKTITSLDELKLQNVSQTESDTAFLTAFTNTGNLTHKLQVEKLLTDDLYCGTITTDGATIDMATIGSLNSSDVNATAITLGGVKKTAWPESGGSDYTYIEENTNNHVITVGAGSIVVGTNITGTTADILNLEARQTANITASQINLSAGNLFALTSPTINASNGQITLYTNNAVGTLSAIGLNVYDNSLGKFIRAGVISTDGGINHTFTGSIVASDPSNSKKIQISPNKIAYQGRLSGAILEVYDGFYRDNYATIRLGDTYVGSIIAEGLYLGRRDNMSLKYVMSLDTNDSNHKTAYIGTSTDSIDDFKFCGTLLNSTGNSSPRIYYTNSQATSGVDNMKAALDDLYNRVAALGQ